MLMFAKFGYIYWKFKLDVSFEIYIIITLGHYHALLHWQHPLVWQIIQCAV